jgi:hypothetical protein
MDESKQEQEGTADTIVSMKLEAWQKNGEVNGLPAQVNETIAGGLRASALTSLEVRGGKCGFRLEDDQLGVIAMCLQQSGAQLHTLSLTYHNISSAGIEFISRSLLGGIANQEEIYLQKLDLEGNEIKEDGLRHLQLHDSRLCPLRSLTLTGNPLGEEGGMVLADSMKSNVTLEELVANNCGFSLTSLIGISNGIGEQGYNSVFKAIEINRPIVPQYAPGEETLEHFSRLVGKVPSLSHLSMKYHIMLDSGARLFAESLGKTELMVSLDLECNKIGVAGAEALASYLIAMARAGKRSIEVLKLSHNVVADQGAIALSEALMENKSLRCLTIKSNSIGKAGLVALGNALNSNNSLEYLSLFGNDFDNQVGKQYDTLIAERLPYVGLSLDIKTYVVDGVYNIAEC